MCDKKMGMQCTKNTIGVITVIRGLCNSKKYKHVQNAHDKRLNERDFTMTTMA